MTMHSTANIRFNNKTGNSFTNDIRTNVNNYFQEKGLSKNADLRMKVKVVIMFILTFVPYFLIMSTLLPPVAMLLCCIVMGIGTAGFGFNVMHDALHGSFSSNKNVNKWLGRSFNLVGGSDFIWKIKHNQNHHTYTNIFTKDEDIDVVLFFRFSPYAPYYKIHRIQHIIAPVIYGFLTVLWVFIADYARIVKYSKLAKISKGQTPVPRNEIVMLFVFKALYYFFMIALPIMVLPIPVWQVVVGFLAMHFTAGLILTIVFQLAHTIEDTEQFVPEEGGQMENAWTVHQMKTTSNFAMKSKFVTWFTGGLNYQVEHHLFPNVCSIHYPAISNIVRETAEAHGVPYKYYDTMGEALISHYRILKQLSRRPAVQ